MVRPEFLKPGDKVGFVAPARSVAEAEVELAVNTFKQQGLDVVLGKHLFGKHNQFSGTDAHRSADIQQFLDSDDIKAIISVRGGYGSVRTIDRLNFKKFVSKPKWFVGYSDITVFHSYINNHLNIQTLHAPMPFNFGKDDIDQSSITKTFEVLLGTMPEYTFANNPLNCSGKAKGLLIGGNLSILYSLRGTPADIDTNGKILFIEDVDEYLYHIDRMMMNLKYGGKLNGLRAVIVGDMTQMKDNAVPFGNDAYGIISDVLGSLNIPVCFGFNAGHGNINLPLIMGSEAVVEVANSCKLTFS